MYHSDDGDTSYCRVQVDKQTRKGNSAFKVNEMVEEMPLLKVRMAALLSNCNTGRFLSFLR